MDWLDGKEEFFFNPRLLNEGEANRLRRLLPQLPGHIWLFTSGTSQAGTSQAGTSQAGSAKCVALSKHALLCSSASVNAHLEASHSDRWLCVLPTFHVGGAQILSRAFLSNSKVITADWQTKSFTSLIIEHGVTLTSLVPQQLYDLVTHKIQSPPSLRALIIGGGSLPSQLYNQAKELGYPVMPSYGLTECASQVATACLSSPDLGLLSHIQARIDYDPGVSGDGGILWIKSDALLTGFALIESDSSSLSQKIQFIDPKVDGWLKTEDIAALEDPSVSLITDSTPTRKVLKILGRVDEAVKVSGYLVNIAKLRELLHASGFSPSSSTIINVPDERRENRLVIALEEKLKTSDNLDKIKAFCTALPSHERPREVCWLSDLPKTDLGKVKIGEVKRILQKSSNSN